MERVLHDTVFGDTVYPDCENAGQLVTMNECLCMVLTKKDRRPRWCGTAVNGGACPIGKKPQ